MQEVIDSHCHLDFPKFNRDRDEVIERARNSGVVEMVNSGIDLKTNTSTLALAKQYDFIHPTIGLSPLVVSHYGNEVADEILLQLEQHAAESVGIGEAGLDYHYYKEDREREHQKEYFRKVIEIAESYDKPLVIHGREAEEDCFAMVRDLDKVIFHCYGGSVDTAAMITDAGYYISIPTIVCFSEHHRSIAENVPLDRILIETDSPYLSPRKGRNEPAFVRDTLPVIAEAQGMEEDKVAKATLKNTRSVFDL
ncbi:TatD family hydrolase [Methanococcoides methylutens]|uniref:Putative deoxyribonuclease YcfH n=1 Tax=Methanococcoides methylutens MM1 TaxID=1434104 RepID=A0A0E3SQ34_METMT|nr:TatD family hydrolase [Methanococcoides methylutens]AKB84088.1 Putative deoxyribonuclease YcfH [Methanococcoides methylutens MM1]